MKKTTATTAFALVLSTSFALGQPSQAQGGASTGPTSNSANSEKPGISSGMSSRENSGMSDRKMIEPGDFAVTDGVSDRTGAWNPTGQVDPGTSNSPGPNSGGE